MTTTAAKDFEELIESIGLAGTAAADFTEIMARLQAATVAVAAATATHTAAARVAASIGATVKRAPATANEETAAAAASKSTAAQAQGAAGAKKPPKTPPKTQAAQAVDTQKALAGALGQVATSSTSAGGALGVVQRVLSALGPQGQAVAVALGAVALVLTAVVAGLVRLAQVAIEASQAKARLRESLNALTGGSGAAALRQYEALARVLPFTTQQLADWAKPLLALKASGADVAVALKGIAAATALMGEEGGRAAQGLYADLLKLSQIRQRVMLTPDMQARLAQAGVSAQALARELGVTEAQLRTVSLQAKDLGDVMQRILLKQGAGAIAAMGRQWDTITSKLRGGVMAAFSDLSVLVDPFMGEAQKLAAEFFEGAVGSNLLGSVVRTILKPAFEVATSVVRQLHVGLLVLTIYALRAYIWLDKIGAIALASKVGFDVLKATLIGVALVAGILAVAIGLSMLPIVVLAAAAVAAGYALYGLWRAIVAAVGAIVDFGSDALDALSAWVGGAFSAASDFVAGLVQGIAAGAGSVADAVKALANQALSAFTGVFGIKSPSTVMHRHGRKNIAEDGLAKGIDKGAPEVKRAMTKLAALPKGKGVSAGGGGQGRLFNFYNCTFGSGMTEQLVRDLFNLILDEEAAAGPEPEPEPA